MFRSNIRCRQGASETAKEKFYPSINQSVAFILSNGDPAEAAVSLSRLNFVTLIFIFIV